MKFVYPITKGNGKEFKNASEFEATLKNEPAGQYGFNPGNSSWHGGMHFSLNNAPHAKEEHPIRAIADGKIVACRINSSYQKSTFKELELEYSNDFCLIEHTFRYGDTIPKKSFVFYSLYMHLAPLILEEGHLQAKQLSGLPDWLYTKIKVKTKVDSLRGRSDASPEGVAGSRLGVVPKDTVLSYHCKKDVQMHTINGIPKKMARCTTGSTTAWFCIEDEFVERTQVALLPRGTLTELKDNSIHVKAGDEIGYLGKFEVPLDITADEPSKDTRYQVHFEVFSKEQPPEEFLKAFFGEATAASLMTVEGQGSEGFLDQEQPSHFFVEMFKVAHQAATSTPVLDESDIPGSEIVKNLTPWDSGKHVVAHHESEWYNKASDKVFLDELVGKYTDPNFSLLIEHEKERIDQLIWMQEAKRVGFKKEVWNWWPISGKDKAVVNITKDMLRKIWKRSSVSDDLLQSVANDINGIAVDVKLDSLLRLNHFFAQIRQEVGVKFSLEEDFTYQETALKEFSYYKKAAHVSEAAADGFPNLAGRRLMTAEQKQAKYEIIANKIYGSHREGTEYALGNTQADDGWKYRGRGLKQLTGKSNYKMITQWYNDLWPEENVDFVENPDLLLETKYAVRSGALFWLKNNVWEQADKGDSDIIVDKVTAIVNKKTDSYAARRDYFVLISQGEINLETGVGEGSFFNDAI